MSTSTASASSARFPGTRNDLRAAASRDRARWASQRTRASRGHQSDDEAVGDRAGGHGAHRRREGHAAGEGFAVGVRRGVHRDRARHRDGQVPGARTSASPIAAPSSIRRARDADQERRHPGPLGARDSSASCTTRRTGLPRTSGSTRRSPPPMATCRSACGHRRGQGRPVEPARHQGHRRAAARLRGFGAAVRDLGRARGPYVQPHAGAADRSSTGRRATAVRTVRCRPTPSRRGTTL